MMKIGVVSIEIFLFRFARFSSNGVYFNGLKLSVCDFIVKKVLILVQLVLAKFL